MTCISVLQIGLFANLALLGSWTSWDPNLNKFTHAVRDCMTNIDSVDPMIQAISRADHLSEETRIGYSSRLALIATAAKNKALQPVLTLHPQKVLNRIFRSYTEVGTQTTMIVVLLAAFKLLNLKAMKKAS